jgi:hypothetical protein
MDPTWHEIGGVSESALRVFKDIHTLFNCHIPTISYVSRIAIPIISYRCSVSLSVLPRFKIERLTIKQCH